MNDDLIAPILMVIDEVMQTFAHRTHPKPGRATVRCCRVPVPEPSRARPVHDVLEYLSGALSVSRFNCHLHALADGLSLLLDLLAEVFATREAFVLDSMPVPVCRRARAGRCRKVRGRQ